MICQVDCVGVLLRHASITLYPPLSHFSMTCQSFSSCYQLHHVYIWLPGPAWRRLGSMAMIVTFILGRNTRLPLKYLKIEPIKKTKAVTHINIFFIGRRCVQSTHTHKKNYFLWLTGSENERSY